MPSCCDLRLVEDLDLDAGVAGERRRALGELPRRQRVARLVGQLAREVAALAEHAAARHRGVARAPAAWSLASMTTTVHAAAAAGGGSVVL